MFDIHLDFDLLEKCNRCGACYDICPSCLNIDGYDPRAVIKDILNGNAGRWLTSVHIYQCLECHHCLEICYQNYGFENAMTAMRLRAARQGIHPPQVRRGWDMFVKTSRLGEPSLAARKKLGLPEPRESGKEEFLKLLEVYRMRRHGPSPCLRER
ncbi:MAG: 4Fe-4S dicluster domain-containing protein [Deltaproteobacteria bacterium]|nr:4Fe-4S dicluster domain-containing protein [Deltaproteobacteria bacterium]